MLDLGTDAGLLHARSGGGVGVLAVNRLAGVGLLEVEALGKGADLVVACRGRAQV